MQGYLGYHYSDEKMLGSLLLLSVKKLVCELTAALQLFHLGRSYNSCNLLSLAYVEFILLMYKKI